MTDLNLPAAGLLECPPAFSPLPQPRATRTRCLELFSSHGYNPDMRDMNTQTQDLIRICEALPEAKRAEVADFARFLLTQEDDERWEQIIASPAPRPKLDAFLQESVTP
ncbi:MAG: hypothetical protein WD872_13035 [Pirellulaceae bacterium]